MKHLLDYHPSKPLVYFNMEVLFILDLIFKLLLSSLMGFICGLGIYFLDYTFWKGSIFGFYLPWLAKHLIHFFRPKTYHEIESMLDYTGKEQFYENLQSEAESNFFYKMLGGCPVCFGIWIAMISWSIICFNSFFEWYFCFPYIFVSSWKVRQLVNQTY